MARDPRWHTGWILSFLAMQFIFALIVLALNSSYWAQYGGVVHSQLIQSGFASEPPFEQNVEQVTKPLKCVYHIEFSSFVPFSFLAKLNSKMRQSCGNDSNPGKESK